MDFDSYMEAFNNHGFNIEAGLEEYASKLNIIGKLCENTLDKMVVQTTPDTNDNYLSIVHEQDIIHPFEQTLQPQILDNANKLTEEELDHLLEEMETWSINMEDQDIEEEYASLKSRLMNLTYNEKYISYFTGEKTENIYNMARDKLLTYLSYGDEIDNKDDEYDNNDHIFHDIPPCKIGKYIKQD